MLKASAPFLSFIEHHRTTHNPDRVAQDRTWRAALQSFAYRTWGVLAGSQEPHVEAIRDRSGDVSWQVYDPVTDYHNTFASEQDVRVWLEKRYYH